MITTTKNPREVEEHDILVVRRENQRRRYFRIDAGDRQALYTGLRERSPGDSGHRGVVNVACPESTDATTALDRTPRGPALSTLPLHPDPSASAACTCYLLNPDNLRYTTSWTWEDWNDQHVDVADDARETRDEFELLVATPAGKVYYVRQELWGDHRRLSEQEVPLAQEAEIWNQLRNGLVAGSVLYHGRPGGPAVVPIVNVQSLVPAPAGQGRQP
jgi:hypothetical protein